MGWKTLRAASQEQGIPIETAIARLSAAGIAAQADLTLREIASRNNRHAPELLALIKADPAR
jgi:hypothetical protein